MPHRWERLDAQVGEDNGDDVSVWSVSRSRWLDPPVAEDVKRPHNALRMALLRKRIALLAR